MSQCQEKYNCQLKGGLKGKKNFERKIVFARNVIRNEIRDRKIKIQNTASLLFIYDQVQVVIVRLMQLNCQLKKLYSLKIGSINLLPLENSLGFAITSENFHQSSIKLCQLQKTKQQLITRIVEDSFYLYCPIIFNQKEDLLIISGKKIYFLEKEKDWNIVYVIQKNCTIYDLSIKDDKNLICTSDEKIFILQKNQNKWELLQKINFQRRIRSVCFITSEIFVVYESDSIKIDIFKLNETKKEFTNTEQVRVQGNNKCDVKFCYINGLNMFFAINGKSINIFEVKENGLICLKEIFKWNRNKQQIVECSKNFLVTKFSNKKLGIILNKIQALD